MSLEHTLILALGTPLRADDGLGVAVLERLRHQDLPAQTQLVAAATCGLDVVLEILEYSTVFVVDAARFGGEPGEVRCFDLLTTALAPVHWGSGHAHGLAAALELSKALGTLPSQMWLFAVEPCSLEFRQGLSDPILRAIPRIISRILAALPSRGSQTHELPSSLRR